MSRILIIGGSGFVGQNVVPYLLAEGHELHLLNRGNRHLVGINQIVADRENRGLMKEVASKIVEIDVIIDTSALKCIHTEIAWEAFSNKTSHWIHISSASVYKETLGRFPNEKDLIGGGEIWGEYGEQKSKIDEFLIKHGSEKAVTILRPPYLYGPKDPEDRAKYVWSRVLNNEMVAIPGNGLTPIQFLHTADLATAIIASINHPPKLGRGASVYNVASQESFTFIDWVNEVAKALGRKSPGVITNDYHAKPRSYFSFRNYPCVLDVNLIEKELGWRAKFDLERGLKDTLATYHLDELRQESHLIGDENELLLKLVGSYRY